MRTLGLVRYTSSFGHINSIVVDVSSATRLGQARISRGQIWRTTGDFLSFLMGSFATGPDITPSVFDAFTRFFLVSLGERGIEALVTTTVTGNLTSEQIRGTPSQGSGGRTTWLDEHQFITLNSADGSLRSFQVVGRSIYGSSSWRTLHLARRLFQNVFGMDVTSSRIQWSN